MSYIMSCDAGTTSARTLIFDEEFKVLASSQREIKQWTPFAGALEHDANELWKSQLKTMKQAYKTLREKDQEFVISALGVTNQRETIIAWDRATGEPLYRALVWQDQRTMSYCQGLKEAGHEPGITSRTGLLLDPYFSASKIHWLLTQVPEVRAASEQGRLCLGTVDSWLIFKLTRGESHVTDVSNASRTLLMNIHTGDWDPELCDFFGVPIGALPEILENTAHFGTVRVAPFQGVLIAGVAGDQQASLFGHQAFLKNDQKTTYGTGAFMLKNIGRLSSAMGGPPIPEGVLETIAWKIQGKTYYAHEGSIMMAGAAVQYLRDQLTLIKKASETEELAQSLESNEGVYFVPALSGLGTPYWDPTARGLFIGLTRGTSKAHFARAALEAIAYQTADLIRVIPSRKPLKVDGGMTQNQFLMQFLSDILGREIHIATQAETTALGAAMLAGLGAGLYSLKDLKASPVLHQTFKPQMKPRMRAKLLGKWQEAVQRSRHWVLDEERD